VFLVVDNLPPELECNFERVASGLLLSVNDTSLPDLRRIGVPTRSQSLSTADEAIAHQEVKRWVERMQRFYPAFLRSYLRWVGRRASRRYVTIFRDLSSAHRSLCYISWGYKDLSTGIARHFIPEDRRIELENGFFRTCCLSVTNKALMQNLGIETLRREDGGRRLKSRFKLLQPQFWEDGVTYHQMVKKYLLRLGKGRKARPTADMQGYDLLIALQLDFDSATVENGNGWDALRLLEYINQIRRGESVLVRAHPFEKSEKVRRICRSSERYGFKFSQNTLQQDLAMSRYVVTINSSVIGDCITSGKPFFFAGVIPEELRAFGQPVCTMRAVFDGEIEPIVQPLSEPLDPAQLSSHIAVRNQ
jgi:hypothetical protein